jgi:hypothetical protein
MIAGICRLPPNRLILALGDFMLGDCGQEMNCTEVL